MKKLVLLLLLTALCACALAEEIVLPSFGATTGLVPDKTYTHEVGGYAEWYTIRYEHYQMFMERLAEEGYELKWGISQTPPENPGLVRGATFIKGDASFYFQYLPKYERIEVRYPYGSAVEPADAYAEEIPEGTCADCRGSKKCPDCEGGVCSVCALRHCSQCEGSGICLHCMGSKGRMRKTGHRRNPYEWTPCNSCNGSGNCYICQGKGSQKCYICNDSLICQTCQGSAECASCK